MGDSVSENNGKPQEESESLRKSFLKSPQTLKPQSPQTHKPLSPKPSNPEDLKLSTPQTIKPSNP